MRKYNMSVKAAFAVCVVLLSACSSDNDIVENNDGNKETPVVSKAMKFRASMDGENTTRTTFNNNSTTWAAGDAISILNMACGNHEPDKYTIVAKGEGVSYTKEEEFEGGSIAANGANNDQFYAIYPSTSSDYVHGFSSDANGVTMQAEIPTVQTATAGSYDQRLHFMTAYSTNSTFEFNNVCALLKITITGSTVSSCRIKVVANPTLSTADARDFGYTSIAGKFDATIGIDGTTTVTATEDEKTYVELRAAGDDGTATTKIANNTYYLAVLPVDIPNGFTLLIEGYSNSAKAPNGKIYQRVSSKITKFERNKIYDLGSYNLNTTTLLTPSENAVDLDLPSGTLWAVRNLNKQGSLITNQYDDADYFSWGENEVVRSSSYSVPTLDANTLTTSNDYAYAQKTSWRYCMPVYAQMFEFYNHFSYDKMNSFRRTFTNGNSNNGAEFTSATGRTLWLPYSGYYTYTGIVANKTGANSQGRYWSRTYAGNKKTYCLELQQQTINGEAEPVTISWSDNSEYGYSIRPVVVNEGIAPLK